MQVPDVVSVNEAGVKVVSGNMATARSIVMSCQAGSLVVHPNLVVCVIGKFGPIRNKQSATQNVHYMEG